MPEAGMRCSIETANSAIKKGEENEISSPCSVFGKPAQAQLYFFLPYLALL